MKEAPPRVERLRARAFTFPLEAPESDGTLVWDAVTVVVATACAADQSGLGYSYGAASAASLIEEQLRDAVLDQNALAPEACWQEMVRAVRNLGLAGVAASAISAVDVALWDLKAKLLGLPLVEVLGAVRDEVAVYGSGGFTSLTERALGEQLERWAEQGMVRVKMKVGREPDADLSRVEAARRALGDDVEVFVDANGAYRHKQALALADAFAPLGVTWLEEPVSSDDLDGLRFVRERCPSTMAVAAGEYGYDPWYFRRMLEAHAVDVLQADATRCLGVTGYRKAAALAEAFQVPLSSHTAPALHAPLGCSTPSQVHAEWFHDHALVERALFDGTPALIGGAMVPNRSAPGLGLVLRTPDVERYAA